MHPSHVPAGQELCTNIYLFILLVTVILTLPQNNQTQTPASKQVSLLEVYASSYLGTESSPRSDFSGLQRTVMTELRPCSHEAVACLDLKQFTVRTPSRQTRWLGLSLHNVPVVEVDVRNVLRAFRKKIWFGLHTIQRRVHCCTCGEIKPSSSLISVERLADVEQAPHR